MAEMKRILDVVLGSMLLLLAAPLAVLLALLILLDSGRPVLFVQERVGLHGRIFRMLKFRSMRTGEYEREQTFTSTSPDEAVFYDPNVSHYVTRVGRYLRMSSLDELPQLLNVVRGDMSLVGPRPVLPGDMVLYGDDAEKRCSVHPGITGLYQISGRKNLPLKTAMRLDLEYVDRQSALYDLWILARTPLALLNTEDAN
jgi:lipopolysaccharide/colanic/teichoic acid biosynthesis glycosyltransferase